MSWWHAVSDDYVFFFPHLRLFVDLRLHGAPKFSQVCPFLNAVVISPVDLSILHVFFCFYERSFHLMNLAALLVIVAIAMCVVKGAVDLYFPQFHVRPEQNWVNDPNGPFRSPTTGIIHLWMQYNPSGPVWGNMSWWHAVSEDYVSWTRMGVSLANDASYDVGGVFSGSVTLDPSTGVPTIVYTCVDKVGVERQCSAFPDDPSGDPLLTHWSKASYNPIVEQPFPGENGLGNFRDPTTAWISSGDAEQPIYEVAFGVSRVAVTTTTSQSPLEAVSHFAARFRDLLTTHSFC